MFWINAGYNLILIFINIIIINRKLNTRIFFKLNYSRIIFEYFY